MLEIFNPYPERLALRAWPVSGFIWAHVACCLMCLRPFRSPGPCQRYDCNDCWCGITNELPFQCSVAVILSFLQNLIEKETLFLGPFQLLRCSWQLSLYAMLALRVNKWANTHWCAILWRERIAHSQFQRRFPHHERCPWCWTLCQSHPLSRSPV